MVMCKSLQDQAKERTEEIKMDNISFSALLQLQFIHDFPCVSRFVDTSDSPMWAIWQELLDAGYIIECQGYSKCGEELIENGAGYDITPAGNAFLLEFNKKLLEHDVTSIYLDKDEYKLLKTMLKRPDKEVAGKQLEPLVLAGVADFKYVEKDGSPGGCVAVCNITKTGRRYIQYRSQNAIRTWAPIIISELALIISIVSLGLSLSQ